MLFKNGLLLGVWEFAIMFWQIAGFVLVPVWFVNPRVFSNSWAVLGTRQQLQ